MRCGNDTSNMLDFSPGEYEEGGVGIRGAWFNSEDLRKRTHCRYL